MKIPLMSMGDVYGYEAQRIFGTESEPTGIEVSGAVDTITGKNSNNAMSWVTIVGILVAVHILFTLLPSE